VATLRDVFAARNRRLPEHKRIAALLLWNDPFPRTASMKVKREALAEQLRIRTSPADWIGLERSAIPLDRGVP
jgi:hypothetical protein